MSRTTVLQIIAAVITIAVLAVLRQGLDSFLSSLEPRFMMGLGVGLFVGTFSVLLIWFFEERKQKSAASGGRTREQQSPRDFIDL